MSVIHKILNFLDSCREFIGVFFAAQIIFILVLTESIIQCIRPEKPRKQVIIGRQKGDRANDSGTEEQSADSTETVQGSTAATKEKD